jgi:hypothetical protein
MTVTRRRQSHVILSKDTIDGHKQQIYLDDQNATISEDTDYTYLVHHMQCLDFNNFISIL